MLIVRAGQPGRPHPARGLLGEPQQLPAYDLGVVDVAGERLLGADALVRLVRHHPARVPAPATARAGATRRPSPSARTRVCTGVFAMSPTVRRPSRVSSFSVFSPTPHSAPTGSGCRKADDPVGRDDEQPVRLAAGRRQLGDELAARHPDRAGDALLVGHPVADQLADLGRPAEPADGPGHVEERLVQRQRLDQRRHRPEDLHHRRRTPGVLPVRGGTTVACGHSRRARLIGIADGRRTGGPRTSPRAPRCGAPPPTITGVPRSSGAG